MDRGIAAFWLLCAALTAGGGYFTVGVAKRRAAVASLDETLTDGAVARVGRVLDGDSLVVVGPKEQRVVVRLVGIKAFRPENGKDPAALVGRRAAAHLDELVREQPLRVLLNDPSRDRHGRTLATLLVGDRDVALDQVKAGLALVYTVYPFPAMSLYLEAQDRARRERRGVWATPATAARAEALVQKWAKETR